MPDLRRKLMDVVYTISEKASKDLEFEGYSVEEAEEIAERILVDAAIDHLHELDEEIIKNCTKEELDEINN